MSRVGKNPISIPEGVTVKVEGGVVSVAGPKGDLSQSVLQNVKVVTTDGVVTVNRDDEEALSRANHGLMRSLINNMIEGVSKGFTKKLEVNGVGFRVALAGQDLRLSLGYSHESVYKLPEGIQVQVDQNTITINGIDKQQVGQAAAEIRSLRKPEPYKGKGIQYSGERILRKSGKSGKETGA